MRDGKFRVLLLDTKFRNPNHYICIALRAAIARSDNVEFVIKADPLDAIGLAHKHRCNLFIAFDGEDMDTVLCQRLAAMCGQSLLWVTEDPYEVSVNKANARIFDLVFTNDSSSVFEYGDKGRHLPLAGAIEFHERAVLAAAAPLRYELFFAGTAWPNRTAFIRSILGQMPESWRFKLALPVNEHLPPRNIDLPDSLITWRTSPVDFGRFVNRSAITLLLPRVFSASGNRQFAETPPPRLFEAALAGGVQLVQEALAEATQAFEPDTEIVLFSDTNDFFEKASAVIADRPYRNRIATAARARALREHTYDQRVSSMLSEAMRMSARPEAPLAPQTSKVRRTVLWVCHNFVGRGDFGGVEVYLDRLRGPLAADVEVLFLVPGAIGGNQDMLLLKHDYTVLKRYTFADAYTIGMLLSSEREKAFHSLLVDYNVDLVHFHHFIGHPPSYVYVAKALGIPTAFTVHDYASVCHEYQLISFKGAFCGAPDVSLAQCDICLWNKHQIAPGSQAARRDFWNGVLAATDLLIFNTAGARDLLRGVYPAVRQHAGVQVMPVPILDDDPSATARAHAIKSDSATHGVLKIAVPGNLSAAKGGDLIPPVAAAFAHMAIEFHVFGHLGPGFLSLKNRQQFPNIIVHGPYKPEQLPSALREFDVSLHLSIWPETYCLTLSECWQNGIVPIVTDIGALGERVEHGVNGLKIRVGEEGDLINAIRLLAEDRHFLARLRLNLAQAAYSTLTPHAQAMLARYRELFRNVPHGAAPGGSRVRDVADLGIVRQSTVWLQPSNLAYVRVDQRPDAAGVVAPLGMPGGFTARLRLRVGLTRAYYINHGALQTARLLAGFAKRTIWKR